MDGQSGIRAGCEWSITGRTSPAGAPQRARATTGKPPGCSARCGHSADRVRHLEPDGRSVGDPCRMRVVGHGEDISSRRATAGARYDRMAYRIVRARHNPYRNKKTHPRP